MAEGLALGSEESVMLRDLFKAAICGLAYAIGVYLVGPMLAWLGNW